MKEGYIKKEDRKKILLITDDIRVHSGIAQIGREIALNTAHRYNWAQLAGSVKHPDKGKIADLSSEANSDIGIDDAYVKLYPVDGYGTPDILREVIQLEKPDAILLITDPRYFQWVFNMEEEIRNFYIKGPYLNSNILGLWLEDLNDEKLTEWFVPLERQENFVMQEKILPFKNLKIEVYFKKEELDKTKSRFMEFYEKEFKHYGYLVD